MAARDEAESESSRSRSGSGNNLRSVANLAVLASLIVAWFFVIQRFGEGNVYAVLGPFACAVSLVSVVLYPRATATWLRPTPRAIAIGLGFGVAMTALTYPVFHVVSALIPSLDAQVAGLYHGARSTTLPKALTWVVAIILAEELLFRGAWPAALQRFCGERAAYAISLVLYSLAQYGTGSWIVMLMALVCGTVWTAQRLWTGSLLSPLISHLIWSPTVILLYPVT